VNYKYAHDTPAKLGKGGRLRKRNQRKKKKGARREHYMDPGKKRIKGGKRDPRLGRRSLGSLCPKAGRVMEMKH